MGELSPNLRERVQREFEPGDQAAAQRALLAYESPGDEEGAERVRHAMLKGARGDLRELRILSDAARLDYRDVLWWTDG